MTNKISGKYFGTEIDEKWWKRYTKNKMLARGNGEFTFDEKTIFFLRALTKKPLQIEIENIIDIKIGKWHAGQWGAGKPILKILWKTNGELLSSGFSLSKEVDEIVLELEKCIKNQG